MAEDIEQLVLAPFREIAEKGRLAMQNAIAAEPDKAQVMKKMGNALVKEGERAVKRMEPLCQRHHEKSGSYFVDALKDEGRVHSSSSLFARIDRASPRLINYLKTKSRSIAAC